MKNEESLVSRIVDNYLVEIRKDSSDFVDDHSNLLSEFQNVKDILLCNAVNENYLNRLMSIEISSYLIEDCCQLSFKNKVELIQKINTFLNPLRSSELKECLIEISTLCDELRNNLFTTIPFYKLLPHTRAFADYLRAKMSIGISGELDEEERSIIDIKFLTNFFIKAAENCIRDIS